MPPTPGDAPNGWDYVIVGSGAGGGTLAARLVEAGMRVFVLEAGGDPRANAARLPEDYDVPAFHGFACENPAMSWNFRVRHYADEKQQARDWKYAPGQGVLYPRAGTLGGCTSHNAMIFMLPHASDWNHIAQLTGDPSWQAGHMHRYAQRVEDCRHRPLWRELSRFGIDPTKHGWSGWLRTEKSIPLSVLGDDGLLRVLRDTARTFTSSLPTPLLSTLRWIRGGLGDPNARRFQPGSFEGLCYTPLATSGHRRTGVRERLLDVARRHPGRLHIELDALATRVLIDPVGVARGVAYLKGERLYRAHATPSDAPGEPREVRARREVILCGGAFNTPQLLLLSGVGPAAELRAMGIPVHADLAGVGSNLQDRYEVAVTHRMRAPWEVLDGAHFDRNDTLWRQWQEGRSGMYASNGAAMGVVRRSEVAAVDDEPDLFCMALLARFEGYFPGFSHWIRDQPDQLTWAVLKGHTRNRAGTVRLRSTDPRDMPLVDFRYFEEGSDKAGDDLKAVADAIRFVRRMADPLIASGWIAEETAPGRDIHTDESLAAYVRDTAWGHHASCSCPIGAQKDGGVLDSAFQVHGIQGLRVVDASAFRASRASSSRPPSTCWRRRRPTSCWVRQEAHHFRQIDGLLRRVDTFRSQRRKRMAYDVPQLLDMSQEQLDELFRASPPGDIPSGEAEGTAIIAPGTRYTLPIAKIVNVFGWQGKVFDAEKGVLKNKISPIGVQASWPRFSRMQAGSTARNASCSTTRNLDPRALHPRRDPADFPALLPWQGLLGQGTADRFQPAVLRP